MGCCGSSSKTTKLNVEGMNCGHCKMTIEKELGKIEGVKNVAVNLKDKTVTINHKDTPVENLKKAITKAGYQVI